ncbi:heat shock protein GrpE [Psychromonas sp. CNPT3]|uniref:nucleotide exchange factor GrpE n=1 Tax=Psychromonas sp. CNPT3 TaxID=314282 RepID=UPI00006E768A|nr:nucleotide exchange factor GrpE [Psychromonas sp. CNPT3]AGH81711.1 heat shock protein GrpE [Psychromonas sp. CNPT3]
MSEEQKVTVEDAIEKVLAEETLHVESVVNEDVVNDEPQSEDIEVELDELAMQAALIKTLETKLEVADEALKTQKDLVIRAQAHAQNEIRKAGIDAENKVKRTLKRFTEELLPAADSLEMALNHIDKENEALVQVAEGVELTLKSMLGAFSKVGIMQMDPLGEQANPEKHQVVSMQKVEGKVANEIILVMQKGYVYNGQVIRPAMVTVASA